MLPIILLIGTVNAQQPADNLSYFAGHSRPIHAVVYSPDGKTIATGSFDGTIRIWDRASGELVRTVTDHNQPVLSVDISRDGRKLVSGAIDGSIKLFDLPLRHPLAAYDKLPGVPSAIVVSPDGKLLFTGDSSRTVRQWNQQNGKALHDFAGSTGAITDMIMLADQHLLTAADDGSLRGWRIDNGAAAGVLLLPKTNALVANPAGTTLQAGGEDGILRTVAWPPVPVKSLPGHTDQVAALAISADGKFIATGMNNAEVNLLDATTGALVRALVGQTGAVTTIALSADNQLVATGNPTGEIKFWNCNDGTSRLRLLGHTGIVHAVAFHPTGKQQLVSAGADSTIRIWQLELKPRLLTGHTMPVQRVVVSSDGKTAATTSADKTLRVWKLPPLGKDEVARKDEAENQDAKAAKKELLRVDHPLPPTVVAMNKDGKQVSSGDSNGTLRLFSTDNGESLAEIGAHAGAITSLDFHPDPNTNLLLSSGADGLVKYWDLTTPPSRELVGHDQLALSLVVSKDGKHVITGGANKRVLRFDATTGKQNFEYESPAGAVASLALSPDNQLLAAGTDQGRIQFWSAEDGANKSSLYGHAGTVNGLAIHPDGKQIASAGADGTIRLWNIPTSSPSFTGHEMPVHSLAMSSDKQHLVTGDSSGKVYLWSFADRQQVRELKGHSSAITAAAFRGDGQQIATADVDGNIHLWNAEDGASQGVLQAHDGSVTAVDYSSTTKQLISSGADGTVKLWQLTDSTAGEPWVKHPTKVNEFAMSPNGKFVVTGGSDGRLKLTDVATGNAIGEPGGVAGPITSVAVSSDSEMVAAGSEAGVIKFWNAAGQDQLQLFGHEGSIHDLAFHPEGKMIASAGADETVRLWQLPLPAEPLAGHVATVRTVATSPDGKLGLTAGGDKIRLWNLADRSVARDLTVPGANIGTSSFSNDSQQFVTGSDDGTIHVWNVVNGELLGKIGDGDAAITSLTYHPLNKILLSTSESGTAKLWQLPLIQPKTLADNTVAVQAIAVTSDAKQVIVGGDERVRIFDAVSGEQTRALAGHSGSIAALALSTDNTTVATGGDKGVIKFWNLADGADKHQIHAHEAAISTLAFHPAGTQIASGSADGTIRIWQRPIPPRVLAGHSQAVNVVAVSPNGLLIATAASDNSIRLWNFADGAFVREFKGHSAPVLALAWKSDSAQLVTGSADKTVRVWTAADGVQTAIYEGHAAPVHAVAFKKDGSQIASAGADKLIKTWNVADGKEIQTIGGHGNTVNAVDFTSDGNNIVSGSTDGTVRIWNAADGKQVRSLNHGEAVNAVVISRDGKQIASAGTNKLVKLWNLTNGAAIATMTGHVAVVTGLDFSTDGTKIVSSCADGTVRVWDPSGQLLERFVVEGVTANCVAFAADGRSIVAGGGDNQVRVFTSSWQRTIAASKGAITNIAFNPDGTQLLAGAADKTVQLWNAADGKLVRSFVGNGDAVNSVAVSPDGRLVASSGADKSVRMWWLADAAEKTNFTLTAAARALHFSGDSSRLAVACDDKILRVWDLASGKILEQMAGHAEVLVAIDFAADNKTIVTAAADKTARVWTIAATKLMTPHKGQVRQAVFGSLGTHFATVGDDASVKLWDPLTGAKVSQFDASGGELSSVAIRKDGLQITAAGNDKHVYLWNVADGKLLQKIATPTALAQVDFSADQQNVLAAGIDKRVRIFATINARLLQEITLPAVATDMALLPENRMFLTATGNDHALIHTPSIERMLLGHAGPVTSLAFSPNGALLISGGVDKTVRGWTVATGAAAAPFTGTTDTVTSLAVTSDGATVFAGCADKIVRGWNIAGGAPTVNLTHSAAVHDISLSNDRSRLAATQDNQTIHIWDLATGRRLQRLTSPPAEPVPAQDGNIRHRLNVGFATDNSTIFSAGTDNVVRQWKLSAQRVVVADAGKVNDVVFVKDGSHFVSGGDDKLVKLWGMDGKLVRPYAGSTGAIQAISLRNDGTEVAGGTDIAGVFIWNLATAAATRTIVATEAVVDLAYNADDSQIAIAFADRFLRIYNPADGLLQEVVPTPDVPTAIRFGANNATLVTSCVDNNIHVLPISLRRTIAAHAGGVNSVAYTPDGTMLLSGGVGNIAALWSASDGTQVRQFAGFAGVVTSVAVADDASQVIAASEDKTVRVFTLADGQLQTTITLPAAVRSVSISADKKRLAIASDDHFVRVWDLTTGRELQRFEGHQTAALDVAFFADNRTLASVGDNSGRIWTTAATQIVVADAAKVNDAKFMPDGKQFLTGGDDTNVKLWNSSGELVRSFSNSPVAVRRLAIRSDGGQLAAGGDPTSAAKNVYLWNTSDGALQHNIATLGGVTSVGFSPDNEKLVVGGMDQRLRVYRASDALLLEEIPAPVAVADVAFISDSRTLVAASGNNSLIIEQNLLSVSDGHVGAVSGAVFASNGDSLITAGADKTVRQWNLADGKQLREFTGVTAGVTSLDMSHDGTRLVAASMENVVHVWAVDAESPAAVSPSATFIHPIAVRTASISDDGRYVVTGSDDNQIRVWDVVSGGQLERFTGHAGAILSLAFSPNGKTFISGSVDKTARQWTRAVLRGVAAHEGPINDMARTVDGKFVFTAGDDKRVAQWDSVALSRSQEFDCVSAVHAIGVSGDGKILATGGEDANLRLWSVADGSRVAAIETPSPIHDIALSNHGTQIVLANDDQKIRTYALSSGGERIDLSLHHESHGHVGAVTDLGVTSDGRTLFSAGADGIVKHWQIAAAKPRLTMTKHSGPVYATKFRFDGAQIASGGADGTVRVWDAIEGKQLSTFAAKDQVMDVAFSPNGQQLVSCGLDRSIRLFDAEGNLTKTLNAGIPAGLYTITYAPAGNYLLAAGRSKTWQRWTLAQDSPGLTAVGHNDIIYRAAYNPKGTMIATIDYSGKLFISNASGIAVYHQQLPVEAAYSLAYSPDGKQLAIATSDPRLILLTLPTQAQ
jgi:WD40 repeat protein